ncbi:LOB domain-containing protein 38-like [Impatiens glandulifera]|uniref:LOB domain-containing protein 38-like n=1 Tax=Impatiens glandulifera TaxID=253017 RepID=UPI001FB10CB2|nr:LOB domain-containing protein 38-like [Impatiens glandulifera]
MSCNGCRVLRKGCGENCALRPCLEWMDSPDSQSHATVFLAKFFGRAGLISFISSVPQSQRPDVFKSLLFEACGRTINPVHGAVGLLRTGNWHLCQTAVQTVIRGGNLNPMPEFLDGPPPNQELDDIDPRPPVRPRISRSTRTVTPELILDMGLGSLSSPPASSERIRWLRTSPSMNSQESGTTTCHEIGGLIDQPIEGEDPRLLNLFN